MNEEQLKYYYKGAYEVGLMFAMLIDRYTENLNVKIEQCNFPDRLEVERAEAYERCENWISDMVGKMLSGNIYEFVSEVADGDKS